VIRFLTWMVTTAVAVAAATLLIDGIYFTGPVHGMEEVRHKLVPLLVVSLIMGVVTAFVKPVLTFLSIPLIVLTLGLFLLLINAGMLKLTSWLALKLDIGFHVAGFWPAVGGAIVITVVTWIVDSVIGDQR
jgi:putative membrane protein